MENANDTRLFNEVEEELKMLDEQEIDVEGVGMKPSQCFHYSFAPVHLLFNTNCPDYIRKKVSSIFEKYGLNAINTPQSSVTDLSSDESPVSIKDLKPAVHKEGNIWYAASSSDLAKGIIGKGISPEQALQDFDKQYERLKENSL